VLLLLLLRAPTRALMRLLPLSPVLLCLCAAAAAVAVLSMCSTYDLTPDVLLLCGAVRPASAADPPRHQPDGHQALQQHQRPLGRHGHVAGARRLSALSHTGQDMAIARRHMALRCMIVRTSRRRRSVRRVKGSCSAAKSACVRNELSIRVNKRKREKGHSLTARPDRTFGAHL
jgi:hypothetical protein